MGVRGSHSVRLDKAWLEPNSWARGARPGWRHNPVLASVKRGRSVEEAIAIVGIRFWVPRELVVGPPPGTHTKKPSDNSNYQDNA